MSHRSRSPRREHTYVVVLSILTRLGQFSLCYVQIITSVKMTLLPRAKHNFRTNGGSYQDQSKISCKITPSTIVLMLKTGAI